MAPKAAQKKAMKKAAKQKKMLIVLGVALLGALVFAYMTLSKLGGAPKVSATPVAATTPASSIPNGTPVAVVTPGITAAPVDSFRSFTELGRKDPFHDNGPHASAAPSAPNNGSGGSGKGSGGSGNGSGGGGSKPQQPAAPLTGAVVSFNGTKLALALGTAFGHAPGLSGVSLFRLLSVTPKTAVIGVVGTQQRFTLHVRQPLTLEQAGGWTYTLLLEPLGSAAPMTVAPSTPIHDQQP